MLALLDEVLDAVGVPVLAAGGIGTGRALAAVLAAGADGPRMGTRFVAAAESDAHPRYVEALIASRPEDTVRGRAFVHGWNTPGRVLRSCVEAAEAFGGKVVGEGPSLDGMRIPSTGTSRRWSTGAPLAPSRRCRCGRGNRSAG